jgi:hypothetical protein
MMRRSAIVFIIISHSFVQSFVTLNNNFLGSTRLYNQKTDEYLSKSKQQFSLGKIAFSLIPLSPESIGRRKTILTEVVSGKIWTLDQIQGVINVNG